MFRPIVLAALALLPGTLPLLAEPAAPSPDADMTNPGRAALAYGSACVKVDLDAALRLLAATPEGQRKLNEVLDDLKHELGGVDAATFLRQFLLVPVLGAGTHAAGKVEVDGDTARVPVSLTLSINQTYVMRRQKDGTWKLDLPATIKISSGERAWYLRQEEMEQQQTCISNLKQLALAVLMFAQDHDETFPSAEKWTEEVTPYLNDPTVLKCPASGQFECSYAFNANLAGRNLAEIAKPAEVPLFFESAAGTRNASAQALTLDPKARHNGGYDFAFMDGHVKWFSAENAAKLRLVPEIVEAPAGAKLSPRAACLSNLRALADAALRYAKDHDSTLPQAKTWAVDLKAYLKDDAAFRCFNEAGLPGGYALNAKVAGKALADIADPGKTVLFFETTSGDRNAADALESLVPEGRHNGGNNFAYVDGHVTWLKVGGRP